MCRPGFVVAEDLIEAADREAVRTGWKDFADMSWEWPLGAERLLLELEKSAQKSRRRPKKKVSRHVPRAKAKAKARRSAEKGMVQLRASLIRDPNITANELRVLALLLTRDWGANGRGAFESQDSMASSLGCSTRTLRRTLDTLVSKRYVTVEHRGVGRTNVYRVADKYRWAKSAKSGRGPSLSEGRTR